MPKKETNELLIIAKRNQKMNNKRLVLDRKYSKMLGTRKQKLEAKKQREIERYERKWKLSMERELKILKDKERVRENKKINRDIAKGKTRKRKIRDTEPKEIKLPQDKSVSQPKKEALRLIQRYRKLKLATRTTEGPMVFLIDTLKRVKLDENVHGGHCYSKGRYPHMMFEELNIRPISSGGNRKQLDSTGEWFEFLPQEVKSKLEEMANNKVQIIRKRKDYEAIIEQYRPLVEKEEERLGIDTTSQKTKNGI